jgi:hypothetical protein
MECKDFQQKLFDYIENILPSEERMIIEEHLRSCSKCNESLEDLRKTVDCVHSLEDIKPPSWLTQKVMAKIKAEVQPKKGIIQKLFYPMHVKLPIEAVVTAIIAVITIYIFKTMQPEMKLAQAPSEHETVIAKSPSKVDGETISKKKIASPLARNDKKRLLPSSPSLEKATPIAPSLEGTTPSLPSLERTTPSTPPLEKGGKGGFEAKQPVPAKKPMIMDKLEEAPQAPSPMQKQDEVTPSAGAVAKEEVKTEVLSRAAKAKVSDEKMEIVNVTVLVKDIKTARTEIEITLTRLGVKIIKTEFFENKEVLTAAITSQKLTELIARLKSIGNVKNKEIDIHALEVHVEIIIEVMKQPLGKK